MLLWLIIGCEIGFWVLLAAGLFIRYILNFPSFSKAVLLLIPVLDLTLLVATAADLHNGATAQFAHGLAAVYFGFTVVFGGSIVQSLDEYAAHRFASGERGGKAVAYGWTYAIYEWKQWLKGMAAGCIAVLLIFAAIAYVDEPERTIQLHAWFDYIFWSLAVWCLCWPVWYTLFPKQPKA